VKALILPKGTIKRIHVSQVNLRMNRKLGEDVHPVFTVQTSKGPLRAYAVTINGHSKLIEGKKPLSCGARVWIETKAEVQLDQAA